MLRDRTWPLATSALQRARQARTSPLTPAAGGGGGVTPSPTPNWTDMTDVTQGNWQQITGIGSTITLSALQNFPTFPATLTVRAIVNNSASTVGATFTTLPSGVTTTFTVAPNQYVAFDQGWESYGVGTVTIKNVTDGNTTLDTFTIYVSP